MKGSFDLQATQQIITLLESAKSQDAELIDRFPGIYAVVDSEMNIYRGNRHLADILNIDLEFLLGKNVASLFKRNSLSKFRTFLSQYMISNQEDVSEDFEFVVDGMEYKKSYVWNIERIPEKRRGLSFTS